MELIKELSYFELLFAKRVKQYNEDGEEIKQFTTPFEMEERKKALIWFNSFQHKKMACKYRMKKRIIDRVLTMQKPCFCTFTFNDKALNEKDFKRSLRYCFKTIGLKNYCLITDYGSENQRLHFHGFVDLNEWTSNDLIQAKTKKHANGLKSAKIEELLGFNLIVPLDTENLEIKKVIGYCLKYATKDITNTNDFEHNMFCSRCKHLALADWCLPF